MNNIQDAIINEAIQTVAAHYVQKMTEKGISPSAEEVKTAIENNWGRIQQEILTLSSKAQELLAA